MADTEQAAAGAEAAGAEAAEPGGLDPRRPVLPSPRQLLAYLPPLPEALRDLPRRARVDLTEHSADYLTGIRSGLTVGVGGWLLAATLTLTLWATAAPAGADPWVPARVSGQLWLAAHHVLMHAPDGPFGLSPLGFTLLPLLGLFASGRRTARCRPDHVPRATLGAAAGYAVIACVVAACSTDPGLHPEYAQVLFYPAVLALIGHGAGAADAIRPLVPSAARFWPAHAARGASAALAVWFGVAAFACAAALVVHAAALATVQHEIGGGTVGEVGLFLIDLALVPNAVLWAGAVLLGPGFALGTGTSVTLLHIVRGPLPGLPLLAGTPGSQHPGTWWLLLFLLPPAAGATGTLVIVRSVRTWSDRVASAAAMATLCGLAIGVLEMYAGGPVAFGPMSVVGATAWLAGVLAGLEFALGAAIVLGVGFALPVMRAGRLTRRSREPRLVDGCEVVAPQGEGGFEGGGFEDEFGQLPGAFAVEPAPAPVLELVIPPQQTELAAAEGEPEPEVDADVDADVEPAAEAGVSSGLDGVTEPEQHAETEQHPDSKRHAEPEQQPAPESHPPLENQPVAESRSDTESASEPEA